MLVNEILTEMTVDEVDLFRRRIKNLFARMGIETVISDHFLERCTDGNIDKDGNERGSSIVFREAIKAIEKFVRVNYAEIKKRGMWDGVIHDTKSLLNIPFKLSLNHTTGKKHIAFFTIMKTDSFRSNQKQRVRVMRSKSEQKEWLEKNQERLDQRRQERDEVSKKIAMSQRKYKQRQQKREQIGV